MPRCFALVPVVSVVDGLFHTFAPVIGSTCAVPRSASESGTGVHVRSGATPTPTKSARIGCGDA
jgi:hypothetical protein